MCLEVWRLSLVKFLYNHHHHHHRRPRRCHRRPYHHHLMKEQHGPARLCFHHHIAYILPSLRYTTIIHSPTFTLHVIKCNYKTLFLNLKYVKCFSLLVCIDYRENEIKTVILGFSQWVIDCCLMPIQQFFNYTMARTSWFSMRWCSRPTCLFRYL